jgi:hypothetical protein
VGSLGIHSLLWYADSVCRLVYAFDVGSSCMENGATCALELHGNNGVVRRVSLRSTAYVYAV